MSNPFNSFNLSDFKKWINDHAGENSDNASLVGKKVRAREGIENLEEKISIEFGDEKDIMEQFLSKGGTISEQDGNKFLIEVDSGSFVCHKRFLKKNSD